MPSTAPLLSDVLRQLLRAVAGGPISSSEQGVELAKRLYQRLSEVVAPVIGEAGFTALFARSLKKTRHAVPTLRTLESGGPAALEMAKFCEALKAQNVTDLEAIVVAMLSSFIGLLSTFIGEFLTWKLMRTTWPDMLPSETPGGENP